MTNEKILKVLAKYESYFVEDNWSKRKFPYDQYSDSNPHCNGIKDAKIEHLHQMIDKMREFLKQGKREKVMRWLGFMQGVFWAEGWYTLEELMNHNRPDKQ